MRQFEYPGMFQNLDSFLFQGQVDFIGSGHTVDAHPCLRVGVRLMIEI